MMMLEIDLLVREKAIRRLEQFVLGYWLVTLIYSYKGSG